MKIGITGGVGSGKSTILEILQKEYGAAVIIADDVSRELMEPGHPGFLPVAEYFGDGILAEDGSIDRGKLAAIVFRDPEKLAVLNHLNHPLVRERILELIRQYQEQGYFLIVIESAILIQAGYRELIDELWAVHVDYEIRVQRLMESRGYSREKTDSIISNQLSDQDTEAAADFVIDNSGTQEQTRLQIARHVACYKR